MEAEVKSQGAPGDNLEQVKKQYDNMKVGAEFLAHLSRRLTGELIGWP